MCSFDRADVLRENTKALCAACDSAHGRWAKLLGVRALLHPRLRLQEFLSLYNITHVFIAATEKVFSVVIVAVVIIVIVLILSIVIVSNS